MLLLELGSACHQLVELVTSLVKFSVHALHFTAGFSKLPISNLKVPTNVSELRAEKRRLPTCTLKIMGDMGIERQQKICLGPGSCQFAIRTDDVRLFGHD